MKNIFVTGGSGFIGSHLISELKKMDLNITNYDLVIKSSNCKVNNIEGDIMDYEKLKSSMNGHDTVCHLAAMVGVVRCLNDEKEVYRVDYEGVKNIINACKENGVKNLLFASSSEVYGEGLLNKSLHESLKPSPKSPYGIAKMKAEELLRQFAEDSKIKITVIRYCNIYGVGQRNEFVIPIFINKVLKGETIPVCDKGEQVRNFTYISDAVAGTIKALTREDSEYEIFNISSSDTLRIIDIAKKVIQLNGNRGRFDFISYEDVKRNKNVEILVRIPSTCKAEEKLGFVANVKFDFGLKCTYEYYKQQLNLSRNEV